MEVLHVAFIMPGGSSAPDGSLPGAERCTVMGQGSIHKNHAALLALAAKLRRFAEVSDNDGYRGLFLLAAAALDERAILMSVNDVAAETYDPILHCPPRNQYH